MKHCSHHTASLRLKSVTELCALTSSSSIDLSAHVAALMDAVGALFVDDDRKVRCEARKLLQLAIDACQLEMCDISPFFPLMISRLCCAMTHIHEDIR